LLNKVFKYFIRSDTHTVIIVKGIKIKFLKDTPFGKLYTVIIEKDNIQEKQIQMHI